MPRYNESFSDEEIAGEIWKEIPGYEGLYSISDHGRVRRDTIRTSGTGGKCHPGAILSAWDCRGYWQVILCKDKRRKHFTTHRLVAMAFLENPQNKLEVNHKDGDTSNARLDNLEWCTHRENEAHAAATGLKASGLRNGAYTCPNAVRRGFTRNPEFVTRGEQQGPAKLNNNKVRAIRREYGEGKISMSKLAAKHDVSKKTILNVIHYKNWSHV